MLFDAILCHSVHLHGAPLPFFFSSPALSTTQYFTIYTQYPVLLHHLKKHGIEDCQNLLAAAKATLQSREIERENKLSEAKLRLEGVRNAAAEVKKRETALVGKLDGLQEEELALQKEFSGLSKQKEELTAALESLCRDASQAQKKINGYKVCPPLFLYICLVPCVYHTHCPVSSPLLSS